MTPREALRLQGFDPDLAIGVSKADVYRLAGNAVASPVGGFAAASAAASLDHDLCISSLGRPREAGLSHNGLITEISHPQQELAANLVDFLDSGPNDSPLGQRAAAGLLRRLRRSHKPCPKPLWDALCFEAGETCTRPGCATPPVVKRKSASASDSPQLALNVSSS